MTALNLAPPQRRTPLSAANHRHTRLVRAALALAVLAVATIDVLAYRALKDIPEPAIAGVERFDMSEQYHTTDQVNYSRIPPAGGPHAPIWLNCGIYDEPVRSENAVHSLEHGAVWITYRPLLTTEQVTLLRQLVHDRHHLILSPYPGLPTAVAASAWGRQLSLADPADPRLEQFIDAYRSGPQAPEKGGPCNDGIGTPAPS